MAGFAASSVGAVAWSGHFFTLLALLALPMIFTSAKGPAQRLIVLGCYYAASIWPVMPGATQFFGDNAGLHPLSILILWLIFIACSDTPLGLAAPDTRHSKPNGRLPIGLCITALLPTGVVNPLTVAGVLFPGLGWAGLIATIILFGTLSTVQALLRCTYGDALGNLLCLSSRNTRRTVNMARPRHRTWRFRTIQTNADGAL